MTIQRWIEHQAGDNRPLRWIVGRTSPEVVSEMIPDLQALADRGERPTQVTR